MSLIKDFNEMIDLLKMNQTITIIHYQKKLMKITKMQIQNQLKTVKKQDPWLFHVIQKITM